MVKDIKYYWATIMVQDNVTKEPRYETKLFENYHPVEFVLESNRNYRIDKILTTYMVVITWGFLTKEEYDTFSKI